MRTMRRFVLVSFVTALGACGPAPEPPANPTWESDVYPLLRGNCLHCHGATYERTAPPSWRFDVCDPAPFRALDLPSGTPALGAAALATPFLDAIQPKDGKRARMPPPPAATLSDYDLTVLKNWASKVDRAMAGGGISTICQRASNNEPRARLIDTEWENGKLWATIEVTDADDDTVMGKLWARGNMPVTVPSAGRHTLEVPGAGADDADDLVIKLSDGTATTGDLDL